MEEDDDNQVQGGLRVRIEVTYWIASHVQSSHHECEEEQGTTTAVTTESSRHYFDATNTSEVRVGLPIGAEPVKPQPGDDTYSGMHDQGPLPEMKEGGPMALLIGCVDAAKTFNNDFLTTAIQTEKLRKALSEQQQEAVPLKKKTKTEDEASSG